MESRLKPDWNELERLFRTGSRPLLALEGAYAGEFLALRPVPGVSRLALGWLRGRRPWRGKVFNAYRHRGENLVSRGFRPLATVIWPLYHRYRTAGAGELAAFPFTTCIAPIREDPHRMALALDYDLPENPRWIVRRVLDEVVQVEAGLYLGKAYLRLFGDLWLAWAFFTLRPR